jgi:hypothetical protein
MKSALLVAVVAARGATTKVETIRELLGRKVPLGGLCELAERNLHVLVTAVRFCVDRQGVVYGAIMVHTSGIPAFDQERLRVIGASRYRPIVDEGRPIPACTITVEEYTFTRAG